MIDYKLQRVEGMHALADVDRAIDGPAFDAITAALTDGYYLPYSSADKTKKKPSPAFVGLMLRRMKERIEELEASQ